MQGQNHSREMASRATGRAGGIRWLAIAFAPIVLWISGCAQMENWVHNGFKVGPNYAKPAAPVASEWIDFNDPRVISGEHGVDNAVWWQTFEDPVLDGLIQTTYQQNLPLRVAGLRVLEAEAQRAVAVGNLFPQFQEAFAQFQQTQISAAGNAVGFPLPIRSFGVWTSGLSTSWELDLWGRYRRTIESADAQLDASIENYDDVLVTLIADTATAYVNVRSFQMRLNYARANVATQETNLRLAQARFDAGAVSKLDVTQSQTSLEQTKALIPALERGLRQANNQLCILLGVPPRDLMPELGEGPIPDTPPDVVLGIPADLLRRRPDVRQAEREVAAQSARIGIAAADLFPAFTINGSVTWQASDFGRMFTSAANSGVINPTFNWNILNYGRILNAVAAEEARFQQLAVQYQQTVLNANREVEDAVVDFLRSSERVQFLENTVRASEESVSLAEKQYREGAIDFDRVNNLQRALVVQQQDLVAAEAEVALGLIRAYRALGGGWQIRYGYGGQLPPEPADDAGEPTPAETEEDPQRLPPPENPPAAGEEA